MFSLQARFLIVDDSPVARNLVRTAMNQMGYRSIDDAVDGDSAWDKILKAADAGIPYELIVTDINMPEMDGLKLLETIRAESKTRHTPVLIITTEGGKQTVIKAVMSGVSGYMVKPFGVDDVKNKIVEIYKRFEKTGSGFTTIS